MILRHDSSHYNIKIIIIYSAIFLLLINYLYFTFISANKLVLFIFSNHFIHLFCLTTLPYLNRKLFCPTISLFTTTAHAHIKFAYISEMVYRLERIIIRSRARSARERIMSSRAFNLALSANSYDKFILQELVVL